MPLQTLKKDAADSLTLEWVLHVKNYTLVLDKTRCVGCQICTLACPKEAIKTIAQPKTAEGKAQKAKVDVDLAKCNFCGICDVTCPYGAVKVTQNGSHDLSVLTKNSYPQLIRDIKVDARKCDKECVECATACPLGLIKISKVGFDGQPVTDFTTLSPMGKKRVQLTVDINKEGCPTCKVCEVKCKSGSIQIKKTFEGKIAINQQECPNDCHACLDVCPIKGALEQGPDGKVYANEVFCTFCGACQNVCPAPQALTVKRTKINHPPIHSGTWNKTLERLTSPEAEVKELKAQAAKSRRKLVEKRFIEEDYF